MKWHVISYNFAGFRILLLIPWFGLIKKIFLNIIKAFVIRKIYVIFLLVISAYSRYLLFNLDWCTSCIFFINWFIRTIGYISQNVWWLQDISLASTVSVFLRLLLFIILLILFAPLYLVLHLLKLILINLVFLKFSNSILQFSNLIYLLIKKIPSSWMRNGIGYWIAIRNHWNIRLLQLHSLLFSKFQFHFRICLSNLCSLHTHFDSLVVQFFHFVISLNFSDCGLRHWLRLQDLNRGYPFSFVM